MKSTAMKSRARAMRAFTLVEIMIVCVIIGILAALAIPAFKRVQQNAINKRYINDLRQIRAGAERYALEKGVHAPNGSASLHEELRDYVPNSLFGAAPIGGVWDWDYQQHGITAMVSVWRYTISDAQLTDIDRTIDDGNLSTGLFRKIDAKASYILEL